MQFGLVAVPVGGGAAWARQAQTWERQGWDAVLVPDTFGTTSPFPALAAAAAVTTTLRLRSWVLAAPLRTAAATAREVRALQFLSDGRYELGIGTGRPDAERDAAAVGAAWPAPAERIAQLERVVRHVRGSVTPAPPVVVTAAGPRMIDAAVALVAGPGAGEHDRLALALPPSVGAEELTERLARIRASAAGPVRITFQLAGIGDRLPRWLAQQTGLTIRSLRAQGAVALLPGEPRAAAEVLDEWSRRYGIDEVAVPADLADDVLPAVEQLRRSAPF